MVEFPDDLYLIIFNFLDLKDLLHVRMANKKCFRMTQAAGLWRPLLRTQMVRKNLPAPGLKGTNLDDLPGPELERLLRRAFDLQRSWKSPFPVAKGISTLKALDPGRVIFLEFLRRPEHSWLVSVSMRVEPPRRRWYTLECWDVQDTPTCIARREFHQFFSIALNQNVNGENSADIAIQAPFITTYSVRPSPADPEAGFYPVTQFSEREERLHLFCGTRMLTSSMQDDRRLLAWDTRLPQLPLELHNPGSTAGQPNLPVLAAASYSQYIIVIRQGTCELYAVPEVVLGGSPPGSRVVQPLSEHLWPWRVDTVVLSPPAQNPLGRSSSRPPGVSILIRFQSGFPWPINLLHHFDLHPNPAYEEAAMAPDRDLHLNLPYQFPPIVRQTIAAPLRLIAQTDMAVGSHGTAVWIDSHTEDYFEGAGDGQRLASRVSANLFTSRDEEGDQQDANLEGDISDHVATTLEASVMRWNENQRWVKLAVDEEEGKVALGHMDGSEITLLSFV